VVYILRLSSPLVFTLGSLVLFPLHPTQATGQRIAIVFIAVSLVSILRVYEMDEAQFSDRAKSPLSRIRPIPISAPPSTD